MRSFRAAVARSLAVVECVGKFEEISEHLLSLLWPRTDPRRCRPGSARHKRVRLFWFVAPSLVHERIQEEEVQHRIETATCGESTQDPSGCLAKGCALFYIDEAVG